MKWKASSLIAGAGAASPFKKPLGAVSHALLACSLLAACQQTETSVQPAASGSETPAIDSPESQPIKDAGHGRDLTDEELARFLKMDPPMPAIDPKTVSAPLAKAAATLTSCRVDFDAPSSLERLPGQAHDGYAQPPFYVEYCSDASLIPIFRVHSSPVNYGNDRRYRLIPQNFPDTWCAHSVDFIGRRGAGLIRDCRDPLEAKTVPRRLGNHRETAGIRFQAVDVADNRKDFDLQALYVERGNVDVYGLLPNGKWRLWSDLGPKALHGFGQTTVSEVRIYETGGNGYFLVDNLVVAIHP